jgi:hypothetical protein
VALDRERQAARDLHVDEELDHHRLVALLHRLHRLAALVGGVERVDVRLLVLVVVGALVDAVARPEVVLGEQRRLEVVEGDAGRGPAVVSSSPAKATTATRARSP